MTKQRMIELIEIEHECMLRKSHDVCDGNCCVCELVQDDYELHEMYINVISILKAQEPRVMTLSGVRNLKQSTPVWLEDVDKKDVIGALFMQDYSGTKCVDFAIVRDWEFERVTADYMDYGIRWRVWTSRPDQATREATPWK